MTTLTTTMQKINNLVEDKSFRESVLEICKENGCSVKEWNEFKWAIILRFATHVVCNK
jgi:hypothetical protein